MSKYRKFFVSLGASFGVLSAALADGEFSSGEWTGIVIAFVGTGLVWFFPNEQPQ